MRNGDDCMAFYNHCCDWWLETNNVNVRCAVLWADIAHHIKHRRIWRF